MTRLRNFLRDERGASAVEFVIILPVAMLFIFGMIDAGMFAWRLNTLEKATQAGARFAAVTDPVASNLSTVSYIGQTVSVKGANKTLQQGDLIPAEALDAISCTGGVCTCATTASPPCSTPGAGYSATAFANILARVRTYAPGVQASDLVVQYRGSGLGYAGDPNGMQASPLVTVSLQGMKYVPWTLSIFPNAGINLPDFAYSLTMEDGSGTVSN